MQSCFPLLAHDTLRKRCAVEPNQVTREKALPAATRVQKQHEANLSGLGRTRSWSPKQSTQHSLDIITSAHSESCWDHPCFRALIQPPIPPTSPTMSGPKQAHFRCPCAERQASVGAGCADVRRFVDMRRYHRSDADQTVQQGAPACPAADLPTALAVAKCVT